MTSTRPTRTLYDITTPVSTSIEIRRSYNGGPGVTHFENYVGSVDAAGVIVHSLVSENGTPISMSNVQSAKGLFPRKAVPGWQAEMIDWFDAGLGQIIEVR